MSSAVEQHAIYQIANAPLREYPYPHIYVESVFPADFYAQLRRNWPTASSLTRLDETGRVPKGSYPERFVMPLSRAAVDKLPADRRGFWTELGDWMLAGRFLYALVDKFDQYVRERFAGNLSRLSFSSEILVVRDHTHYNIGPHTDAPHRLLSLLFYCPDNAEYRHLGTSIYTPIDPNFRCEGGPHYPFNHFEKVVTMEYLPNTLFAFVKTDRSFHGVDPISDGNVLRDLMLYDVRVALDKESSSNPAPSSDGGLGMKMLRNAFRGRRK